MNSKAFILFAASALFFECGAADAKSLVLIGPGGARAAVTDLLSGFERSTGDHVDANFLSGGATRQWVVQGQGFDVAIEEPPYEPIVASGHVVTGSCTRLAATPLAVAVRLGRPKPDISTPAAVKRLLLAASSISYPDGARGAGAGVAFDQTLQQLGIAAQVHDKVRRAQGGDDAMRQVAEGKVDIGVTFQSEMHNAGIEILGPLPRSIATPMELCGFVSGATHEAAASRELLRYLSSPAAALVYRAHGMQPLH